MKLKEFLNIGNRIATNVGTNSFRLSLNKEEVKTPHYTMSRVLDIIENRSFLATGLRNLCLFILSDITFVSSDDRSSNVANEWLSLRPKLEQEILNFTQLLLGCGTSYFEPIRTTDGYLDMLYYVQDPSTIYLNLDAKNDDEHWIYELPIEVRSFKSKQTKFWPIYYVNGSSFFRKMVWGININKQDLIQHTFGLSRSPYYGHGLLSTSVDNDEVINEVIKNWALIAKYRSLGKKLIGVYNENGESVDLAEIDRIQQTLNSLEEEESLVINKKVVSEDLTFTGSDNMLNQEVDFLRKDSGSSLVPNFMTAFSQDSSMATAQEAKIPFSLQLKSLQKYIVTILNEAITESLIKQYKLKEDLTISLGSADLYSLSERFNVMSQLYNLRACTFNEIRQAAGLETVYNGDVWGQEPPLDKTTIQIKQQENFNKKIKLAKPAKPAKPQTSKEFAKIEVKTSETTNDKFAESVKKLFK